MLKLLPLACALLLGGCAVGPRHEEPSVATPPTYKAPPQREPGWAPAQPPEAFVQGTWWRLFDDPTLTGLVERVPQANQNLLTYVAALEQARALAAQQRAARFPALSLGAGASRSGGEARGGASNTFSATLSASWEPDLFGRVGNAVASAEAGAQASAANLASARLAAQAELAINYFALREADAEITLLGRTVEGYERSLQITKNRYDIGVVPRTDVLQAQTQLASTRADLAALRSQREQYEHAIALLVGEPAPSFSIDPAEWKMGVPEVPAGVPSELLQRRPDIASAERSVASANAQIGVAESAFYPSFSLTGSAGYSNGRLGDLFSAPSSLWSLGLSVAQTLFDAGATRAAVRGAEAARDSAVANYRQTVLNAFKEVEDQLSIARALTEQSGLRREASEAADLTEQQVMNRYRAGQVSYTDVVTAQATALSARRALVQLQSSRQAAAITLIQALGGGWSRDEIGQEPVAEAQ